MSGSSYFGRSLQIILLATVFLALYPLIYEVAPFLRGNLRTYSLLPKVQSYQDYSDSSLMAIADTVSYTPPPKQVKTASKATLRTAPLRIELPETKKGPSYTGKEYLSRFFSALYQAKSNGRKVRIAYFGDSMIEGDLITGTLREDLQANYGGRGVGFVPIASKAPGFRKTIKHSFSKNWIRHTVLNPNPAKFPFGISGDYAFVKINDQQAIDHWVKYEGSDEFERTKTFEKVKLYYGSPVDEVEKETDKLVPNQVSIITPQRADTLSLAGGNLVNAIELPSSGIEAIELHFNSHTSHPIYGLSFENDEGVYIDNFSVRGNSGLGLKNIDNSMWEEFNQHMNYDLVVLHYGVNVINTDRKSYNWYKKKLSDIIQTIQTNIPGTDILVVSVSDKSTKIAGKMKTDPSVPKILYAQRKAAEETEVAFLNLFNSMGGTNSMIKWVDKQWANKDYTHVNHRGAKIVSNIIMKYMMKGFETYEQLIDAQVAEHSK